MNLVTQNEGIHIKPGLHDKDLKWRGSIVLNLLQVRFCDNLSECRREYKLVGSKSYVEQDVDHSLHHIVKRVLGSDDKGRLPIERSKERAAAISAVIESGNAKIGRTKGYECLNEAERDAAWLADTDTIAKSTEPADIMNLGIQYEGSHIEACLHDKDLRWRGSIVLNLMQVRFCNNLSECRREYKLVGSKSYVEQDVDHSLHHIVKRVLGSDDKGRLPIDICQLLGNSDIVQRIPEEATSEDLDKMWLSTHDSTFGELRKRCNLPRLYWFTERFSIWELKIGKLYFSEWEYPPPSKVKSEQGSKIIWSRLKSYIEYMANLGGSPVVCAGGT